MNTPLQSEGATQQPPKLHEVADKTPSLLQQLLDARTVSLRYSVASASSYSGIYHPNNILYNRPHDMSSRWSGSSQLGPAGAAGAAAAATAAATQAILSGGPSHGPGSGPSPAPSSSSPASAGTGRSSAPNSSPRRPATGPASGVQPIIASPSTASSSKQYIILRLDKPCVVRSITFGKYHKPHPCNLRDFKIYGSLSLESLLPSPGGANGGSAVPAAKRLIRGGLRNDAVAEKFELRWLEDVSAGSGSGGGGSFVPNLAPGDGELDRRGVSHALASSGNVIPFALQYIKIVPLAAHTPNYNFSVWHVALAGISDYALVSRVQTEYREYRESSTIRLMLKHLREQGHHTAFAALLQSSRLSGAAAAASDVALTQPSKRPFEDPILTTLFDALVRHGNWDEVEACLDKAANGDALASVAQLGSTSAAQSLAGSASWDSTCRQSMFSTYIHKQMLRADWLQILPAGVGAEASQQQQRPHPSAPSGRGGHSMVLDSEIGIAYLFGGWDGFQDLCDLWAFHVNENRWRLISPDARLQGGPGPRSCHKMCLDEKSGSIYLLGRYIDYESNAPRQREGGPYSSSPSAAATARSTRASFLAPMPTSAASTRDVPMGHADTQAAESAAALRSNSGSRHRRIDELGADPSNDSRSSTPASSAGPHSPGRPPRPTSAAASRTPSSRNVGHATSSPQGREPDFYRFSTKWERWEKLSGDTYADGGPKLIYDHGLVVDSQSQILYVFGGRIADPDPNKFEFSGMWRYDIIQRTWTFLFDDSTQSGGKIVSRSGHSMLLDPGRPGSSVMYASQIRQIWILGGHRGASATNLADMWTYNIATGAVREISSNTGQNGPESGFTQRATIDAAAREISLFVGLIGGRSDKRKTSAFWIYSIPWGTWKQVYRYDGGGGGVDAARTLDGRVGAAFREAEQQQSTADRFGGEQAGYLGCDGDDPPESGPLQALPVYGGDDDDDVEDDDMAIEGPADSWMPYSAVASGPGGSHLVNPSSSGGQTLTSSPSAHRHSHRAGSEVEPRPRYAAQLVFDDRRKVYYLHGGNPEDADNRQLRLDDMWRLSLMRPTPGEVLRRAKFRVRQQRFLEMTRAIASQGGVASGANGDSVSLGFEALIYLQTEVGAVVDHSNEGESQLFRRLMTRLLNAKSAAASTPMAEANESPAAAAAPGNSEQASEGDPVLAGFARQAEGELPGAFAGESSSMQPERPGSVTAKRARDELEIEDDEAARSPISVYASSAGDCDSEMLSISQVLPGGSGRRSIRKAPTGVGGGGGSAAEGTNVVGEAGSAVLVRVSETEGRPSRLYAERNELFRSLLAYFNPELTEPVAELGSCIKAALGA